MEWDNTNDIFKSNIETKIKTIKDVDSLRLFIWKFHNAVNSSILINYDRSSSYLSDSIDSLDSKDKKEMISNIDTHIIEDTSLNDPNYVNGYWPNVALFKNKNIGYSVEYTSILNELIVYRKKFVDMVVNTKELKNTKFHHIDKFNYQLIDIKNDMNNCFSRLDNIIIKSKILSEKYAIEKLIIS